VGFFFIYRQKPMIKKEKKVVAKVIKEKKVYYTKRTMAEAIAASSIETNKYRL